MTGKPRPYRELRIAPVLTGGTSLAVWMGGATDELYRLVTEGSLAMSWRDDDASPAPTAAESVYGRLCQLTATKPVVDVITGSSAGAVNAALLAAAVVYQAEPDAFEGLRRLWMSEADLGRLATRSARRRSLLDAGPIREAVTSTVGTWRDAARDRPDRTAGDVDLVVTFTGIAPRTVARLDNFGEAIVDASYAGVLRFVTADFEQPANWDAVPSRLATAAAASAAIPGVFEAANLEPELRRYADDHPRHPRASSWIVDGGVTVNLPLTEALERIYHRPATELVRRVVLYVSPTALAVEPTQGTSRHEACRLSPPDRARTDERRQPTEAREAWTGPTVAESLRTLLKAPRAEGVSGDLRDIAHHNARVVQQRSSRTTLGWLLTMLPGDEAAQAELFDLYSARRAENSVDDLLERLDQFTRNWPLDLSLVREELVRYRYQALPTDVPDDPFAAGEWLWAITPVEECCSVLASVINRTLELPLPRTRELLLLLDQLKEPRRMIESVQRTCARVRRQDEAYWTQRIEQDRRILEGPDARRLNACLRAAFDGWPQLAGHGAEERPSLGRDAVREESKRAFSEIVEAVRLAYAPLSAILDRAGGEDVQTPGSPFGRRVQLARAARALQRELAALHPEACTAAPSEACTRAAIGRALLHLHILQTVVLGRPMRREQAVEVLQLSWNAPDYITGRTADQKLVGTELGRLGAFLKPSWRANDFFWGQMDAAARLIKMLADPNRMLQLALTPAAVLDGLGLDPQAEERAALDAELAFLTDEAAKTPQSLPLLVEMLARRRQLEIARSALPMIAELIGDPDAVDLGSATPQASVFRDRMRESGLGDDLAVEQALCAMRVGEESVRTEAGSRLFRRSIASMTKSAVLVATSTGSGLRLPMSVRVFGRGMSGPLSSWLSRNTSRLVRSPKPEPATYWCQVTRDDNVLAPLARARRHPENGEVGKRAA